MIRILLHIDLAHPGLQVRRRYRQINGTCGLFRPEGKRICNAAVDDVDASLVDGGARGVAEEVVLGGDDHGGVGGLRGQRALVGAATATWGGQWGLEGTYREHSVGEVGGIGDVVHAEVEVAVVNSGIRQ